MGLSTAPLIPSPLHPPLSSVDAPAAPDCTRPQMKGHVLSDVMQVMTAEFDLSLARDDDTKDTKADASTLVLDMLPIPSQRKLQRWVEARGGKDGKGDMDGADGVDGVGKKAGASKKQRKTGVKKEKKEVKGALKGALKGAVVKKESSQVRIS